MRRLLCWLLLHHRWRDGSDYWPEDIKRNQREAKPGGYVAVPFILYCTRCEATR